MPAQRDFAQGHSSQHLLGELPEVSFGFGMVQGWPCGPWSQEQGTALPTGLSCLAFAALGSGPERGPF